MGEITFRRLVQGDLPLLHQWLQRPHVRRWWSQHPEPSDVAREYGPAITGDEPSDPYFALLDATPVAFLQTYLLASYPDYEALVGAERGAAGVDLFVADEQRTGHGLGTELLRRFVDEVVFASPDATHCLADPEPTNTASMRAFQKAGFRIVREYDDPNDDKRHALVRRDRPVNDTKPPREAAASCAG